MKREVQLAERVGHQYRTHTFDLDYGDGTSIHVQAKVRGSDLPLLARAAGASQVRGKAYKADAFGFIVGIVELIGL